MARKSPKNKKLHQQALPLFWDEAEDDPAETETPPEAPADPEPAAEPEPAMSADDATPTEPTPDPTPTPSKAKPEPVTSKPASNPPLKIVKPADEHSPPSDPMLKQPTGYLLEDTQDRIPTQMIRPKTEPGKKSGLILKKKSETDSHQAPETVAHTPPTTTAGSYKLPIRTQPTITLPSKADFTPEGDDADEPDADEPDDADDADASTPTDDSADADTTDDVEMGEEDGDDTDTADDTDDEPVRPAKPLVAKPAVAAAAAAADAPSRPLVAKPNVAKPGVAKPHVAKPEVATPAAEAPAPDAPAATPDKPLVSKPNVAKPDVATPSTAKPDVAKPDIAADEPAAKKPLVLKPATAADKPAVAKPLVAKPDASERPTEADTPAPAAAAEQPAADDGTLGGRLRLAREDRNLTQQQVAETTHIRADLIAILERRAYDEMPVAAVYTRSYIKTLCKLYELDATDFLADLDEHLAKRGDSSLAATTHIASKSMYAKDQTEPDKTSSGLTYAFVGLAIVVLVVLLTAIGKSVFFGGPSIDGVPTDVPASAVEEITVPEIMNYRELPIPGDTAPRSDTTPPVP